MPLLSLQCTDQLFKSSRLEQIHTVQMAQGVWHFTVFQAHPNQSLPHDLVLPMGWATPAADFAGTSAARVGDPYQIAPEKLVALLEEKCGNGSSGHSLAPPSSNIRNALQACREAIDYLAPAAASSPDGAAGPASLPAEVTEGGVGKLWDYVRNREDAFRARLQVAEFFKRTEPHSPVSYALGQAVRWGRMSLPELLGELVHEQGVREHVFQLIGIPKAREPE